jgi:hypothetical protein
MVVLSNKQVFKITELKHLCLPLPGRTLAVAFVFVADNAFALSVNIILDTTLEIHRLRVFK